jgi:hypothetical protein
MKNEQRGTPAKSDCHRFFEYFEYLTFFPYIINITR